MINVLSESALEAFLRSESIAHLACVLPDGRPYVVPISYAYDGGAFYGYSADGMKLDALRARPQTCISVDHLIDAATWVSVVAWGVFRELADESAADALRRLSLRMHTVAMADEASLAAQRTYVARIGRDGVAYRIDVIEKTGRRSTADG